MEQLEFDIFEYIEVFFKKWYFIVACAAIFGIISFSYTLLFVKPIYTARASMIVLSNSSEQNGTSASDYSGVQLRQRLVKTYATVIRSNSALKPVLDKLIAQKILNPEMTISAIRNAIFVTSVADTEILYVDVEFTDSITAAAIANEIVSVSTADSVKNTVMAGSISALDLAIPPTSPSKPNITVNTIIGMILGFLISLVAITISIYFDDTFKSAEKVESVLNIPILASIYLVNNENK